MTIDELVQRLNAQHQATGAFPWFEVRGTEVHTPHLPYGGVTSERADWANRTRVESHRWLSLWMYPMSETAARAIGRTSADFSLTAVEIARLPASGDDVAVIDFLPETTLATMRVVVDALGVGRTPFGVDTMIRLENVS